MKGETKSRTPPVTQVQTPLKKELRTLNSTLYGEKTSGSHGSTTHMLHQHPLRSSSFMEQSWHNMLWRCQAKGVLHLSGSFHSQLQKPTAGVVIRRMHWARQAHSSLLHIFEYTVVHSVLHRKCHHTTRFGKPHDILLATLPPWA